MQMPMKMHCFPIRLSGKEAVAIATIFAFETIIITALYKNYSVELNGEISEDGKTKGTMKFNAQPI